LKKLKACLKTMNKFKLFFSRLFFCSRHHMKHPEPKISLLIPFSSRNGTMRKKTYKWLIQYWKHELPDAEIVIGRSNSRIFCKGEALNNAAKKAKGRVLVIMDADAYMRGHVINRCADRILEELDNHLWYVPYRRLYRLNRFITELIIKSPPEDPLRIQDPPPDYFIDHHGHTSHYGHRYGAMCMMFPREALDTLGCFDERFKGWGGEDVALLRALDTLYGKHKTTRNPILHLWHPYIGDNYKSRKWKYQKHANPNTELANAYHRATRHPSKMRVLVDAGCTYRTNKFKIW
jgi:predicted glycosyltransferase involved in capsule biosynthesis